MASEADRRRRLLLLGAAVLAAALVVVVLILVSQGGGDEDEGNGGSPAAAEGPADLFEGIPQSGIRLGDPDAPVRMVEFVDLQCPFCAEYSQNALPEIVERYVRPGDLSLELRTLTFLGDDSVTAGRAASAAAEQDLLWQFAEAFFRDQGAENSGYVTPEFLRSVSRQAGADPAPILAAAEAGGSDPALEEAADEADRLQVQGTPAFYVAQGGGTLEPLQVSELTPEAFMEQLDPILGE